MEHLKLVEQSLEEMEQKMANEEKIDWTQMWASKYPILTQYQQQVKVQEYTNGLTQMLDQLKADYGYSQQDAFLVLKDILAKIWNGQN